jgi:hypothetical protein
MAKKMQAQYAWFLGGNEAASGSGGYWAVWKAAAAKRQTA